MAGTMTSPETFALTDTERKSEVLDAPKLSFHSISTDNQKEYLDYSCVATIPCGYYALQLNVGGATYKVRRGYYGDTHKIEWGKWATLL